MIMFSAESILSGRRIIRLTHAIIALDEADLT